MITAIREVRQAKGLTLADVAARCVPPTTAQTIGRLETGTRTVSVDWLNRIATALGVGASILSPCPINRIWPWSPGSKPMGQPHPNAHSTCRHHSPHPPMSRFR
jgi:transcriptional regulator with XRE-family HTH domain